MKPHWNTEQEYVNVVFVESPLLLLGLCKNLGNKYNKLALCPFCFLWIQK